MQELVQYLLERTLPCFHPDTKQLDGPRDRNEPHHLSVFNRYLIGIVGAPGAGKSTFAARLCGAIAEMVTNSDSTVPPAVVVPMDGFHLRNVVLESLGLRPLKGIPTTFDPLSFAQLLRTIRTAHEQKILCPAFDRSIEEPVEGAIEVLAEHRIIIVEGNYLLLDHPDWQPIASLLDEVWYLHVTEDAIKPRLIARHMQGGKTEEQARAKMASTDLPNANLILATRPRADKIIVVEGDKYVVAQAQTACE